MPVPYSTQSPERTSAAASAAEMRFARVRSRLAERHRCHGWSLLGCATQERLAGRRYPTEACRRGRSVVEHLLVHHPAEHGCHPGALVEAKRAGVVRRVDAEPDAVLAARPEAGERVAQERCANALLAPRTAREERRGPSRRRTCRPCRSSPRRSRRRRGRRTRASGRSARSSGGPSTTTRSRAASSPSDRRTPPAARRGTRARRAPGRTATTRSPSGHSGAGGGASSSMRSSRKTRTAP